MAKGPRRPPVSRPLQLIPDERDAIRPDLAVRGETLEVRPKVDFRGGEELVPVPGVDVDVLEEGGAEAVVGHEDLGVHGPVQVEGHAGALEI